MVRKSWLNVFCENIFVNGITLVKAKEYQQTGTISTPVTVDTNTGLIKTVTGGFTFGTPISLVVTINDLRDQDIVNVFISDFVLTFGGLPIVPVVKRAYGTNQITVLFYNVSSSDYIGSLKLGYQIIKTVF